MTRDERPWLRWLGLGVLVVMPGAVVPASEPMPFEPPSTPLLTPIPEPELHVEWGGCADVRLRDDAPLCVVDPEHALRLWIGGPSEEQVEVLVDGVAVAPNRYRIGDEYGHGRRVLVPAGASALTVRVLGATSANAAWSLALGSPSIDPPTQDYRELGRALKKGDVSVARQAVERAQAAALQDGRLKHAVDVVLAAVGHMSQRHLDPEVAEGLLRNVEDAARRYPEGRGDLAYYRGLHHWYTGSIQEAAESFRDAVRQARRLEDEELAVEAFPMYAEALAQLGYFDDARRWAREGLSVVRARDPCELGSVLRTVGWMDLGLRRRGRSQDDPARALEEALDVFGEGGKCSQPGKLGGVRLSLALLALDQGRLGDVAAQIDRIDRRKLTIGERLQVDDLEMRLSLAQPLGPARRRAVLRRLQESVEAIDTADARWRLHVRRGRLLELEANYSEAIDAYRAAELELDALVRLQAVGIGRGERADRYHESTDALVSLLVDRGNVDAAWCIVREDQARRRMAAVAPAELGATQQAAIEEMIQGHRREKLAAEALETKAGEQPRDEAQITLQAAAEAHARARKLANGLARTLAELAPRPRCTDLSPPATDELLLGLYPRHHDWLVFASGARETTVHRISAPNVDGPSDARDVLARALLAPVEPRLDVARRVRVLAHRDAQRIDVDELPWRGEPLGVRLPVSYGVELPVRPAPMALGRRALLLADPTATLEGAANEVELVQERLSAAGWATVTESPELGSVSLAGYDLFHYAGHAEASERPEQGGWPPYPGGEAGWAAFLELGPAGRLTVHEVMTVHPAPRAAVLAGCRTGALELDTGQTSMALAFLVAGSEQVLASAEAVDDARGARFARRLYDALVNEPGVDLALAMQQAQRGLWEAGEEPAGYRVWVR